MRLFTRFWIGVAVGGLLGVVLLYIAASAAFGEPQSFRVAQNLFPYALAVEPAVLEAPWLVLTLAVVQYPLYGGVLAFGLTWKRYRLLSIVAMAALILGAHLYTVRIAQAVYEASQHAIMVDNQSE